MLSFYRSSIVSATGNLIGYWKFDEGTGSSPADSSGSNVSGSFTSTQPTWSTDVPTTDFANPYSLDFTRTGDGVTIAWPSGLNFGSTAPRSFSFWYKPTGNGETASGNYDRIISWTGDGFEIAGTYGDVSVHRLAFYDGSWRDTGYNMSVGTWYNITFTYDGTNVILYVNNVQKFSGTSGGRALSGTMYIGTRHTGDEGINGLIDDVRVYDRALTPSEVQVISEGGSGPGLPTSTPTPTPTPTAAPTSTPTNTPTPTVTSTSTPTSSSQSTSSGNTNTACADSAPAGIPDLFQVSTSPTSATVYFSPVGSSTGYIVSYGEKKTADQYAASFDESEKNGVRSYTIKSLSPGTTYYFKIRAKNGCQTSGWSESREGSTTGVSTGSSSAGARTPTPTPKPRGNISVIKKEQSAKEKSESMSPTPQPKKDEGYELAIRVVRDGKPVAGASVELHSLPRKTITDHNGIARFSGVEKGEHKVLLSYSGYTGQEKVSVTGEKKDIEIKMTVQMNPNATYFSLSSIIVIAFLLVIIAFFLNMFWKRRKKKRLDAG